MATIPLTDSGLKKRISEIDSAFFQGLNPSGSIPDGGGLSLQRQEGGSWLWFYRFRIDGQASRMSLGAYPAVTLAKARELHKAARELVKQSINPARQRAEDKAAKVEENRTTFEVVAWAWWENWRIGKNDDHALKTWSRLEKDVLPLMGKTSIHALNLRLLSGVLKDIESRAPKIADKIWVACGQIFRFACANGIIERNPMADIRRGDLLRGDAPTENMKRVPLAELPDLLRAIDTCPSMVTRLALQLMALIFVRHSELRHLEWTDIDWEAKTITIPAERMKQTARPTPHIVPLSYQAIAILRQLQAIHSGRKHIFPSTKGEGRVMSNGTLNKALHQMGYQGRQCVHGFKGLASTVLYEADFNARHIELQLAHMERNKVVAAYNHASYLPQRTKMMQWYADYLDARRTESKVIKFPKVG